MILLDTHVVIWLAGEEARISKSATAAIAEARREKGLAISGVPLLEVAMLSSKGRIELSPSLEAFIEDLETRFALLPITGRICIQAFDLPANYPNDPVDRVIGATALVEGLTLITADGAIRKSRVVPTLW